MSSLRLFAALLALLAAARLARCAGSPLVPDEPSAGPGAVTLLIYNEPALPYSLMDLSGVAGRLLTRVNTRVVAKAAGSVSDADIRSADYIVTMGAGAWPAGADLPAIGPGKPVLVCGMPPRASASWPGAVAGRDPTRAAESWPSALISTGQSRFESPVSYLIPVTAGGCDIEVLAKVNSPGRAATLAWRSGTNFWFPALPIEPATGFVFSGVLPAFYGIHDPAPGGVLLVLEDFRTGSDPSALRRAADFLAAKSRAFAISVRMPGDGEDPAKVHEFVSALQYAQARRGRLFLIPTGGRFWDVPQDRPSATKDVAAGLKGLQEDFRRCLDNGLLPLGVRLPDAGLSAAGAAAMAGVFDLALGGSQASDATAAATFSPGTITRVAGRLAVIPCSPWFVGGQPAAAATARNLLIMPGAVLSVSVPAWLPFGQAAERLGEAAGLKAAFLDPAEAAASTSTSRGSVWSARAGSLKPLFSGRATLKSYDDRAQTLSESEINVNTGSAVEGPAGAAFFSLVPCEQ